MKGRRRKIDTYDVVVVVVVDRAEELKLEMRLGLELELELELELVPELDVVRIVLEDEEVPTVLDELLVEDMEKLDEELLVGVYVSGRLGSVQR